MGVAANRPAVSAIVCTRGRAASVVATIETILANDHDSFELVVIDQSDDDATERALRPFSTDGRFRYVREPSIGLGRSRNAGLREARADVVVYTDDDVTVPPDWLTVMDAVFAEWPRCAVAFCNVDAGPHDPSTGFIPTYLRTGTVEIASVRGKCRARGIGAGLAVRRSAVLSLGGFDPHLGAGGEFSSCEDGDIALRALLGGRTVVETDRVTVVHHGFRTWDEGRVLTRRDFRGIGACLAKPMRARRWRAVSVLAYESLWIAGLKPIVRTVKHRRYSGLKSSWYLWSAFFEALRWPVDRTTLLFVEPAPAGSAAGRN